MWSGFKSIAAAAFALGAAAASFTAAEARELKEILKSGTIKIGVPESFPPFGSVGASGEHEGYDVDVAKMIAKDMGVKLEMVLVTSKQRIPFLETDRVDLVISTLGANPDRAKSIWFSHAYAPFFSGAFAKAGVEVFSVADLAGKKVAVTGGTLEDLKLSAVAPKDAKITRFGDNAGTIAAFVSGQVDVIVTGNITALQISKDHPDFELEVKFVLSNSPSYIGVKTGSMDLLKWVNVWVLTRKLNGTLDTLSKKWLGQPLPPLPAL
ncbi:MAG: transporter substrate-binding domain-containing protein [Neomegalonema sp.]|nr:transporter substrate-binding domain-containing protein [Neomegalonema sp.]